MSLYSKDKGDWKLPPETKIIQKLEILSDIIVYCVNNL